MRDGNYDHPSCGQLRKSSQGRHRGCVPIHVLPPPQAAAAGSSGLPPVRSTSYPSSSFDDLEYIDTRASYQMTMVVHVSTVYPATPRVNNR